MNFLRLRLPKIEQTVLTAEIIIHLQKERPGEIGLAYLKVRLCAEAIAKVLTTTSLEVPVLPDNKGKESVSSS